MTVKFFVNRRDNALGSWLALMPASVSQLRLGPTIGASAAFSTRP